MSGCSVKVPFLHIRFTGLLLTFLLWQLRISCWGPRTTWSWPLCWVIDKGLFSFFYMWASSLHSIVVENAAFPLCVFWHLCQLSDGCNCMSLCLDLIFCSINLHVYFCDKIKLQNVYSIQDQYHAGFITIPLQYNLKSLIPIFIIIYILNTKIYFYTCVNIN